MAQAKAAEGRRSPRRQALAGDTRTARSLLDCASPLTLGGRTTFSPEAACANVQCNCHRQPARPLRWFEPFDQALMAGLHPVGHPAIPPRRRPREKNFSTARKIGLDRSEEHTSELQSLR